MSVGAKKKALYPNPIPNPKQWDAIRRCVLERARNRCEFCGVRNYAVGHRDDEGEFHEEPVQCCYDNSVIQIVLTIAHLDHNPKNNSEKNLRALCQRCHNRYEAPHRQANARRTSRARKPFIDLFERKS